MTFIRRFHLNPGWPDNFQFPMICTWTFEEGSIYSSKLPLSVTRLIGAYATHVQPAPTSLKVKVRSNLACFLLWTETTHLNESYDEVLRVRMERKRRDQ